MNRCALIILLISLPVAATPQQNSIKAMLSDSAMIHGSASVFIVDSGTGDTIADHNSSASLTQASVMKLITSAAALEILGSEYRFRTKVGYSGIHRGNSRILEGNIIIKGGGDPVLGSERFAEEYSGFMDKWVRSIADLGIKKIKGGIVADDSYYDFQPVPPGWNWEDIGNYYGAGAYGISLFDNTLKIHFRTSDEGTSPEMLFMEPEGSGVNLSSYLKAHGNSDMGYVYLAPYSSSGWISGTIPANRDDFVLKASIPDPPMLSAIILDRKLQAAGIRVEEPPTTARRSSGSGSVEFTEITSTISPPLSSIIEVLNHESVNLYAEHLVREISKATGGTGSNSSGTAAIINFLDSTGTDPAGMFVDDGSGLSPQDAINARGLVSLLIYMKNESAYREDFLKSLPDAGKEGTLKNYFRDPLFENRLWAKSGTLSRVKAYSGYFKTLSGREMAFCIIVNNFTGPSSAIITRIENIIKETILYK